MEWFGRGRTEEVVNVGEAGDVSMGITSTEVLFLHGSERDFSLLEWHRVGVRMMTMWRRWLLRILGRFANVGTHKG